MNPKREVALKIGIIARQMRKLYDRNVSALGVTRSQWTLIAVVARSPGATQRTIAETLEISEASAGRLIDRLCAEGLLERRAKEDDRRAHCVYVTDNAMPMLAQLSAIGEQGEAEMFANVSDQDVADLAQLLDKIYANIALPNK